MIFITLGSREYQFNRLLEAIDELCGQKLIEDEVFAQIGQSDYEPQHFKYERFLGNEEFKTMQRQSSLIISHGGTGALVGALKLSKQVIAVPRLSKFGEHIDDHQLQVTNMLEEKGYLLSVHEMEDLLPAIQQLKSNPIQKRYNEPSLIKNIIIDFIEE